MTARLLEGGWWRRVTRPTGSRCCAPPGRWSPILRASRGSAEPQSIASFLLLDRLFPRSAYHTLNVADGCTGAADDRHTVASATRPTPGARSAAPATAWSTSTRRRWSRTCPSCSDFIEQTCAVGERRDHRALLPPGIAEPWEPRRAYDASRSSRLQIRHVTGFSYDGFAESSYNEARMTPLERLAHQTGPRCDAGITITPNAVADAPTGLLRHGRHRLRPPRAARRLEVTARGDCRGVATPPRTVLERCVESLKQYQASWTPTPSTWSRPRGRRWPRTCSTRRALILRLDGARGGARGRLDWVRGQRAYVTGSTHVTSTAARGVGAGQGVCQDLTHVMIGFLRGQGVPPATSRGTCTRSRRAIGETSWARVTPGSSTSAAQWVGIDPTNGNDIGSSHVVVAKGRDYGDVPPLKGIYHGSPRARSASASRSRSCPDPGRPVRPAGGPVGRPDECIGGSRGSLQDCLRAVRALGEGGDAVGPERGGAGFARAGRSPRPSPT